MPVAARAAGYNGAMKRTRNTVQRRAVREAVRAFPGHPTAADIFARVRQNYPRLSLATVYRALHALVQQGQIGETRIDNVSRYDASPVPHHHVVCRRCGAIGDVPAPLSAGTLRRLRQAAGGFSLDAHSIQLSGLCPGCVSLLSAA